MPIGSGEPKMGQVRNIETIKNNFSRPFDEAKVLKGFESPTDLGDGFYEVYSDNIDENIEYQICIKKIEKLEQVIFHLFDTLNNSENKPVGNLIFKEAVDGKGEPAWNLMHRAVESKNIGVSGTDFLKKAEEYFKILKRDGIVTEQNFTTEVSQPSVLAWMQNNGFTLSNANNNDPSDFIESQDGKYVPKGNYELIGFMDNKKGEKKDPYLIRSDFLSHKEFGEKYIKQDEQGQFYIDPGQGNFDEDSIVDDFRSKGYIPRFQLQKEIL